MLVEILEGSDDEAKEEAKDQVDDGPDFENLEGLIARFILLVYFITKNKHRYEKI